MALARKKKKPFGQWQQIMPALPGFAVAFKDGDGCPIPVVAWFIRVTQREQFGELSVSAEPITPEDVDTDAEYAIGFPDGCFSIGGYVFQSIGALVAHWRKDVDAPRAGL